MINIIDKLKRRSILKDITNENKFKKLKGSESLYIGFDPSATSLHLGNYVQIAILKRFQKEGFKPIAILGGATGMIGDPSGKSEERNLLSKEQIYLNKSNIQKQLESFDLKVIDNLNFYENMNIITFLTKVGKFLNINYMINKEIVSSRIEKGISFTEFSYQLIQGWDFKKLYEEENVRIQVGGSDQWGNITAGIEIIRKSIGEDNLAIGITTNLLTTSNGKKFGKSEGNALWLDKKMTKPFEIYQYLISSSDIDVEKYLNWLTFLPIEKIEKIIQEHKENPKLRKAQQILAFEVVKDIHSKEESIKCKKITEILFNNKKEIQKEDIEILKNNIPTFKNIKGNILDILVNTKLAISKREAKEFIKSNTISINNKKIKEINFELQNKEEFIIKKGKNKIIIIIND